MYTKIGILFQKILYSTFVISLFYWIRLNGSSFDTLRIQIFWNKYIFYLFFRIWNSQFWRIRSGIRIWSLWNRIWLPKCLIFLFTIMKFKNSQIIRQNAAWSSPTFVFIQKQQFSWKKCHLFKNLPSVNFLFYLFILVTPFLYNVIIYYLHHRCWFTTVKNPCLTWFQPRRGFILFSLLLDNGVKTFIGLYVL